VIQAVPSPRRPRYYSALAQLRSELNELYRSHLSSRAFGGGRVGRKTERERRIVIEAALEALHAGGFKLRRVHKLRAKHVRFILDHWRRRDHKASTLSGYFSMLRLLCRWLRKPQLVRLIDEVVAKEPGLVQRRTVADCDRSERGRGVSAKAILDRAMTIDERFACILALIVAFGLRVNEALLFRPHLALQPDGHVQVDWGTKGGRPRGLRQPLTEQHRLVIDWCRRFAIAKPESMIPRGYTLERYRRQFYGYCEAIGLTRKALGVTPHSLRHGVLLDLYEWLTGYAAPARGGQLALIDPHSDRAAREIVAGHAGHRDPYITSAYLGPMRPASAFGRDRVCEPVEGASNTPRGSHGAPDQDATG
jgi:integrase